jgi:hypothetical protein
MAEPVVSTRLPGVGEMISIQLGADRGADMTAIGICPDCLEITIAQLEDPLLDQAIKRAKNAGLPADAVIRLLLCDVGLTLLKMYAAGRLPKPHDEHATPGDGDDGSS